jgi:dTDP-4-dehydrorhamnose reductase
MKILITGGNGYVAKSLCKGLNHYNITIITRNNFDLTDKIATDKWFKGKYFDVIIHTSVKGGSRLIPDNSETFYQNLQMFYNLYYNKHCFSKFLHFGSGAELNNPSDPYGLSKKIINELIKHEPGFYNIRIFGIFDENELNTRFIKTSINKYINKEPINIHQDKLMDFFYMGDLIKLVKHYIAETHLPKVTECRYSKQYNLSDIAHIINNLSDHKVSIKILNSQKGKPYIGTTYKELSYTGLELGIQQTFNKLK